MWESVEYKFDYEKFARLVVKECLRVIELQKGSVVDDGDIIKDALWLGLSVAEMNIKKHFGFNSDDVL